MGLTRSTTNVISGKLDMIEQGPLHYSLFLFFRASYLDAKTQMFPGVAITEIGCQERLTSRKVLLRPCPIDVNVRPQLG